MPDVQGGLLKVHIEAKVMYFLLKVPLSIMVNWFETNFCYKFC